MKRLLFAFVIAMSAFIVGCRKDDSPVSEDSSVSKAKIDKKTEAELRALVEADMKALENEDVEAAMKNYATEDAAQLAATRATLKALFEEYDLSYRLIDFKVISCDGKNAVVEVVQETRKIRGPKFQNNRTTVETRLKKTSSGWKQVSSKIKKVEFI